MSGHLEAKETVIELLDKLINDQKKNISGLEIMKEHVNDMTSEQFQRFSFVFAMVISPEIIQETLKTYSAICSTNATIEHIKEEVE